MPAWRDNMIAAGFAAFRATRLDRALAPFTRGRGAILMFHHVRPWRAQSFAPNRLLEITPEFLDAVLSAVRRAGFDIVSLDEAARRLSGPARRGEPPFAALTFDDGYRDNAEHALPVLERHGAPFTLYCASGFADRSARLWWRELEFAVAALERFVVRTPLGKTRIEAGAAQKQDAFDQAYWLLRAQDEDVLRAEIARLRDAALIDGGALVARACMDWEEIAALARHPLCAIGAYTHSHPRLAKLSPEAARAEMARGRDEIERRLGVPARHFAYPVGDPSSAGEREFALARELGFATAVTTRPGMILPAHAHRMQALPRLSVNGKWQDAAAVETLLTGAPFALANRFRPA